MKNDKVKKWLYLILIFGGFFILRNFVPSGLDQAGWDGFLVLFVAVLLWLTEAVPMAVTAVFVLFFGAWVGFEKEANILANFASTGPFFLLAAMVIGQIFTKVGLGRRISLYVLPMFGNKAKAVLLAVMMGTCVVSMFLADIPSACAHRFLSKTAVSRASPNSAKPSCLVFRSALPSAASAHPQAAA